MKALIRILTACIFIITCEAAPTTEAITITVATGDVVNYAGGSTRPAANFPAGKLQVGGVNVGTGSGTVTSVTLTQPSAGLTISSSGTAITTSGTRTFALADDLAALEALSGTDTIYRRSGTSAWSAVTYANGITFSGGVLGLGGFGTGVASALTHNINTSGGVATIGGSPAFGGLRIGAEFSPGVLELSDGSSPENFLQIGLGGTLTASRGLSINVNNATRAISIGGDVTLGSAFTTSGNTFTTNGVTYTLSGATATLATLAGAESLTNKKLGSLTSNGLVTTSGGDGSLSVTTPGTGVLTALGIAVNGNSGLVVADSSGNIAGAGFVQSTAGILISGNASTAGAVKIADGAGRYFNLKSAASLTGDWILTLGMGADRAVTLGGNLTLGSALTTSGNTFTTNGFTYTLQGAAATLARTDAAQTFTGTQTFGAIDGTSIGATTRGTILGTTGGFNSTLTAAGAVTFTAGTASTTTGTGTVVVTGGVGISGEVFCGRSVRTQNGGSGSTGYVANATTAGDPYFTLQIDGTDKLGAYYSRAGVYSALQFAGVDALKFTSGAAQFPGTLAIGGGTALAKVMSATATLDFGNILAAASADLTVTVTGAAVGDVVSLGEPAAPDAAIVYNAFVSAANTVTVRAFNVGAIADDPASATYRVQVNHF